MPEGTCSNAAISCDRTVYCKSLCDRCYQRLITGIPLDIPPRRRRGAPFSESVKIMDSGCHEWMGARDRNGYGYFRRKGAYRFAWEQANGPIPTGMSVCHHCDNPPCVNPEHLFLGTHQDNIRDMAQKGRGTNWERNRHAKLTEDEVRAILDDSRVHRLIAVDYGVTLRTIDRIKNRYTWRLT